MLLKNPDYNPMPADAESGYVKTPDGISIRYARWKAERTPVFGTVLLLQGRSEYIEKHYDIISYLRKQGFEVLSFDWRGQGGSSRLLEDPRRGYVDDFEQYVVDLKTIIEEVALPDCRAPFYIFAHSTGCLVALLAAPQLPNKIRRMVLSSPLLGFGRMPFSQSFVKFLAGSLSALGLGEVYMAGGATPDENRAFSGNLHTSDTQRFERNRQFVEENRELTIGGPTAAWVYAACHAMNRMSDPDFHSEITIPTLLIAAGNDAVVDNAAIEDLGHRLRSGSCLYIQGARHELMQESEQYREQLLAAFSSFIPGSDG